jgi:phage protein D
MATAPRYVPDFRLQINGQDLPRALRNSITSVRYQDGHQAADRVEIGIANTDLRWLQAHIRGLGFQPFPTGIKVGPSPIQSGPVASGEGLFDIDNQVTLALGYAPGPLEEVFKGEVTGVQCTFPSGGMPSMTLVAHDYLQRMTQGTYARGFGPLPDFLIASILGAENLLFPDIDPFITATSSAIAAVNFIFKGTGMKQESESHLQMLTRIAAKYDADFWVEGDVLHLSRFLKSYTPALTLIWGKDLVEFSPKMSSVGQVFGVAMKFTLREIPLNFLVSVGWDFDRECLNVMVLPGEAAAPAKSVLGPVYTIVNRPIGSPADIANSALVIVNELRNKLNARLTASGSAVGDPRIRAGAIIRFDGLGPDFSGDYRVKGATHSIGGSGYVTNFEVFKEIIP